MLPAFLTTVLFSISGVTGQKSSRLLGGTEANFWRLVLATALLAVAAHLFGSGVAGAAFPVFFLSGVIGFGIGDLALFQALPRIGSRLSVLLTLCLSAPLAAVVEWLWLGTALTVVQILASSAILVGVGLALAPGKHLEVAKGHVTTGILFGLLSASCQGLGAVFSRKAFTIAAAAGENIDGMTAAYQRIIGGVLVASLGILVVKRSGLIAAARNALTGTPMVSSTHRLTWKKAWPWVAANAISGSALGVSCFQWALKTTPTGIVLPIVATTPLVIIPFTRYIEGERPTARSLWGGVVAVVGAVVLARAR